MPPPGNNNDRLPVKHTLGKEERLSSRKLIQALFLKNFSISEYPIRVLITPAAIIGPFPAKAVFSVSKRNFPKAVDRNRIKRLMREAYRLNKHLLYDFLKQKNITAAIAFIYTGNKVPDFNLVQEKLIATLVRLESEYEVTG